MTERRDIEVRRQLAPENDWIVDLAIDFAERRLSPDKMAEVRDRLTTDAEFRAVARPVIDAIGAPPMSYEEFTRYWNDFCRRAGLTASPAVTDLADYQARVRVRSGGWWERIGIAAAIFFALMAVPVATNLYLEFSQFAKITAPENVEMALRLPDGSRVSLSPGSRLKYMKDIGMRRRRQVNLESGAGEFDVASTPQRPFILTTPHAEITVAGTRFHVRLTSDSTIVIVREGAVAARWLGPSGEPDGASKPARAGQLLRITTAGTATKSSRSIAVLNDTIWPPSPPRGEQP